RSGCRGYLAVAGGIEVPTVLGSRSTYVRAGLGGVEGRILRDGDVLPVPVVRVIRGRHAAEFPAHWAKQDFTISSRSDRMGMRLVGEPLARSVNQELL